MSLDLTAEERVPIHRMLTTADYITLWNCILGFAAIVAASQGNLPLAFTLVVVAVLLDGADGALSRLGHGGGRLGGKLDTLSDLVSFCVAPAFIFYTAFAGRELFPMIPVPAWLEPHTWGNTTLLAACGLYLIAGVLRLARFDYLQGGARHDYFVGVTTPSAAVIAVSISLVQWDATPSIFVLAATAGLMVSRVRLPKVRGSLVVPSIVILSVAAATSNVLSKAAPLALLLFSAAYLLLGPSYVRRREEEDVQVLAG